MDFPRLIVPESPRVKVPRPDTSSPVSVSDARVSCLVKENPMNGRSQPSKPFLFSMKSSSLGPDDGSGSKSSKLEVSSSRWIVGTYGGTSFCSVVQSNPEKKGCL